MAVPPPLASPASACSGSRASKPTRTPPARAGQRLQRLQGVEADPDPARQRRPVLGRRRHVRGEQEPLRGQRRQGRLHGIQLAGGHAFEIEALVGQGAQQVRVRVGLDRVVPAGDRAERAERPRPGPYGGEVVDVTGRAFGGQRRQRRQTVAPPRPRPQAAGAGIELRPGRPEHGVVLGRQRAGGDQGVVQARQQPLGVDLVEHEGQVEVVAGLADQVHAQAAELGQDVAQPVQQAAHAAADEGDRRARRDRPDPAERREIGAQGGQHVGVDQVLAGVERDGDVGLGGADQVDREAVPAEHLEDVGQEAHLLPHADGLHRHQGHAPPTRDGLDRGRRVRHLRPDPGAVQLGTAGIADPQGHAAAAQRRQAARMQHAGAGGGDLLRLLEIEPAQQPGAGDLARVGAEQAGDVAPYLDARGGQAGAEIRGRGVGTAAAEQHGAAVAVAGDEALGDEHLGGPAGEPLAQRLVAAHRHAGGQPARPFALVAGRLREQAVAGVEPARIQAGPAQGGVAQGARHQLAKGHQLGLPCPGPGAVAARADGGRQFGQPRKPRRQQAGIDRQFPGEIDVPLAQLGGQAAALVGIGVVGDRLQGIGGAGQRRDHQQHPCARGVALARQPGDGRPAGRAADAAAAELEHDPGCIRGQRTGRFGHRVGGR